MRGDTDSDDDAGLGEFASELIKAVMLTNATDLFVDAVCPPHLAIASFVVVAS